MKNLRKLLAVIITVAMMATMFVIPAFAAETSDADICDTLGMLKGTDGKVTDAYLATTPLRYQAAIMFLRLKGLEEEALAYKGTDNFDDAGEIWSDGQKMLAYLKANPELGFEGIGDNKFDPMGEMTAQAYYKVLLVALGYEYDVDFKWDEVFAFAKEIGLSKVADVKEFTVNDLAIATVEALNTNVRDEEYTLIEFLVAEGVVSEAAAIKAGLVEPEPEVLAVESVSADNLKQVYVEFNGADFDEDAIKDKGNYKLTDTDDKEIKLDAADLDGNTVTLTLDGSVSNQKKAKLTVKKKILGADETFEFEFIDTTLPKALDAKVVGISTIKMIFSEPIDKVDKADFEVDGGDYYISEVKKMKNDTEVNIVLYSALEEGDLEVKIKTNGIEDYAGFSVLKKTFKLEVVEDNEPPVVVGYKNAKPNEVTLIFNEDIEIADGDEGNFYHTNGSNHVEGTRTDDHVNGKELKLTFDDDHKMPEGSAYIYILKGAVRDLWENKNDKIIEEIQVVIDKTPPEIKEIKVESEDEIVITFVDDDLDTDSAEDEDNYKILDNKGEEVKNVIYSIKEEDGKKVKITFNKNLSGDYTLVIDGVKDKSDNKAKITKEFTVTDKTAPKFKDFKATLYKAGVKGQMVKIDFGEKMATDGKYSVLDAEKYVIGGHRLSKLDVKPEFKVINDGKSIEIKIASEKTSAKDAAELFGDDEDGVDLADGMIVELARVADAAGNYTENYTSEADINDRITLKEAEEVVFKSVEATAKDEVKITFKDYFNKFDANDVVLTTDKTNADATAKLKPAKTTTSIDKDGNTVLTLKLASGYKLNEYGKFGANGDAAYTVYAVVVAQKSVNKYGMTLALGVAKNDKGEELKVADKIKPTLYSDGDSETDYDYLTINEDGEGKALYDGKFVIQFSEDIVVAGGVYEYAWADLVLSYGTKVLAHRVDYEVQPVAGHDDKFEFTLLKKDVFKDIEGEKELTISMELADTVKYTKDKNGNKLTDVKVRFKVPFTGK